ncbi:helix-turn-helix transcriptional regulator [Roseibium sp. M-1]
MARLPYIYDVATSDNNWTIALDHVAAASGSKGASIYASNNTDFVFDLMGLNSHFLQKPDCVQTYFENYRGYDEDVIGLAFRKPAFRKLTDEELFPAEVLSDGREDFDYLRQHYGVWRRSAYNMSQPGWNALVVTHFDRSLQRLPHELDPETDLLIRHLSKALEINRFCSQLRQRYRAVLAALDHIDVAICIVLHNGEVIAQNRKARQTLSDRNGIGLTRESRLSLSSADLTSAANGYVRACAGAAIGQDPSFEHSLLAPKRDGEDPYLLEISPLRDGDDEMNDSLAAALMLIIDPSDPPALTPDAAARVFSLSPAETAVVSLLLEGKSLPEIAETRSVAVDTIRNQCRAIHLKMGVRNRAELVRKVIGISPPVR